MTNIESIVNALLENSVITEEEAIELVEMDELKDYKSFEDWKRNGFSVKKGEHRLASCIIWSRPVDEEDEDGNKTQSFKRRYANIFSREQVEPTAERKARRELEKKNESNEKKIKSLKKANKVDKEWIESHPNDGENSFTEWQISQREKEIAELEKAESPKVMKNSKKQTSKKSEKVETKKSEKTSKKNTKKAESKKAQPKAEKKLEKADTKKTEKTDKKATKKLATKEVKRSFNISKRTDGKKEYIVITNYDKDGNVKATAELPSNIYSSLDEDKKANFRKIFNIA